MAWLEEFVYVLAYSRKTQWVIVMGLVFFLMAKALGAHVVAGLEFHGLLAPLTEPVREIFHGRYDKLAWTTMGGFLVLAFRTYRKDRKRFLML